MIVTLLWDRGATCGDRGDCGMKMPSNRRVTCLYSVQPGLGPDQNYSRAGCRLQAAGCTHRLLTYVLSPENVVARVELAVTLRLQGDTDDASSRLVGFLHRLLLPTWQGVFVLLPPGPCSFLTRSLLDCRFQFPDIGSSPVVTSETGFRGTGPR